MIKLLVIEDEIALNHAMVAGLRTLGYQVDGVGDGQEALMVFGQENYDLVVLDLNLPHIDGLDLLVSFKAMKQDIKVIILSARSEVEDKVRGFKLGTNDYLAKPFHFDELIARIQSLLLRDFVQYTDQLDYQEYHLLPLKQEAYFKDQLIETTSNEYYALEWLIKHQQDTLTDEKIKQLLAVESVEEGMNRMNQLIEKLPSKFIYFEVGVGYYVK